MRDLFEFYEEQPKELREVCERWEEKCSNGLDYNDCANFLNEVNQVGFTFEYYLDAEPYDLRPMTEEERHDYINENGLNFSLYLLDDTVVKISENEYKNQETQHKISFTKEQLKDWYNKEYNN